LLCYILLLPQCRCLGCTGAAGILVTQNLGQKEMVHPHPVDMPPVLYFSSSPPVAVMQRPWPLAKASQRFYSKMDYINHKWYNSKPPMHRALYSGVGIFNWYYPSSPPQIPRAPGVELERGGLICMSHASLNTPKSENQNNAITK